MHISRSLPKSHWEGRSIPENAIAASSLPGSNAPRTVARSQNASSQSVSSNHALRKRFPRSVMTAGPISGMSMASQMICNIDTARVVTIEANTSSETFPAQITARSASIRLGTLRIAPTSADPGPPSIPPLEVFSFFLFSSSSPSPSTFTTSFPASAPPLRHHRSPPMS